jgi:ectoine hydroxylase-related dioxygenase (phytanoyl-CoA dioxygenase family)
MGDHAILKPPRHGAATPWHQDEAYWEPGLEYNSFSLWVPLQDATLENGCMQFVPGSHRLEVLPHHSINKDPRVHGLEVDGADTSAAQPCPIRAGDATAHLNRTLHYAGPNRTGAPRRAYILGFGTPPRKRSEPREFPWNVAKQTARERRRREWEERHPGAALEGDPLSGAEHAGD